MIANLKETNILVVDDRYDGIVAMQAALGRTGCRLVSASSGSEALRCLEKDDYALILLDVQMPILNGFETAALIKLNPKWRYIPIIFVTAINKDDRYIDQGYEAGAVDYLFKPFDPQILVSKVQVFVDLYWKTKEVELQAARLRENERRDQNRLLMEQEVESLRRYQRLADSIPNIVCKANADGTLSYFNRAWTLYTGLTADESIGAGWRQAFQPSDLERFLNKLLGSLKDGADFSEDCRIYHCKSGEYRWNEVRGVAEYGDEGQIQAWLGTAVDIHDRLQWEAQLAFAKESADLANQAKSAFLANMSHEIRTPLSAIMGFSELMLDPDCTESSRTQSLSVIRRNGQQLIKIIDEILDLSKVEANRLELELIPLDLELLANDLRTTLGLRASEKGLLFIVGIDGTVPKTIKTDPTRIRQILFNVIGNAIKFTFKGSIEVKISFDEIRRLLKFQICDTGIGMEDEKARRLFTPFTQIDSSTTRRFGGTGLGLALSRRLAEALGGNVNIQKTAPGLGSVFEVQVATGDVSDVPRIRTIAHFEEGVLTAAKEVVNLHGLRILLAEDAPDNQNLISRFLHKAGAEVEIANNGLEAIEKAMSADFHLVLMDIQMPILDGYEATRKLRAQGYLRPILALTAHALKEERERCLRSGCSDHLTKPVNRLELIEKVAMAAASGSPRKAEMHH